MLVGELSRFEGAVRSVGGDGLEVAMREEEVGFVGSQKDSVSVSYLGVGDSEDPKEDEKEEGEGYLWHY